MLTQARLKEILQYDPDTGIFTWLVNRKGTETKAGEVAGGLDADGYTIIYIDNKQYKAHRLAWLYMEGYFPEYQIDHPKGKRTDNRWKHLRHVTNQCNSQNCCLSSNNSSDFNEVSWVKRDKVWRAYVKLDGKQIPLGYHQDKVSAALARVTFEDWCPKWSCDEQQVNRIKLRQLNFKV